MDAAGSDNKQVKPTWRETPPPIARQECGTCHGTGWELDVVAGVSCARRCRCSDLGRLIRLKETVRIPRRYERCALENYKPCTLSQGRALAEAQGFAERFPDVARGLFFCGPPGIGKTHLAVAIARELVQRFHEDVLFCDFEALMSFRVALESSEPSGFESERLAKVSLLVLDNFRLAEPAPDALVLAEEILCARRLLKRPVIYTGETVRPHALFGSDLNPDAARLDTAKQPRSLSPRTLAHLFANTKMVRMSGADYRKRNSGMERLF